MYYIYLIVNKINGKTYVGQRKSDKEWYEDKYMGSGKHLKASQNKYGIENFEKFLIQYCYSKEETDKAEIFWIAEYRKRGKAEYNITKGGQGGRKVGHQVSEETRRKISEANKGKSHSQSDEVRKRISEKLKGRIVDDSTRQKLSEINKGKKNALGKHPKRIKKHWKLVDGKRVWY